MLPPGHEPFLRAVCADPADDTVRLVFADWLDENGDPRRAEFIRCQIEAARTGDKKGEAHRRAQKLKHGSKRKWLRELPALPGAQWREFRRGFVLGVTLPAEGGEEALDRACRAVPIQHVNIGGGGDALRTVTRSPFLPNFTAVGVTGPVGDDSACACADRPAPRLETLFLSGGLSGGGPHLTDRGVLALCRSPHLPRLRTLLLFGARLSDEACEEVYRRFGAVNCINRLPPVSA